MKSKILKLSLMKRLLILLFVFPLISMAQEKTNWDYPVKPGSEEWRYTSYTEKLQKNQPPISLMNTLTTTELLDLCMEYPFNMDILLFNNPNSGMRKVLKESSCWQEFIKRKDAVEVLTSAYDEMPTSKIDAISDEIKRGEAIVNICFLEKIISESNLINNSNLKTQKLLLKSLLKKHEDMKIYPNRYFGYIYCSTLSAMLKIMESQDEINSKIYNNTEFHNLVERGICNNKELETEILNKAKYITNT